MFKTEDITAKINSMTHRQVNNLNIIQGNNCIIIVGQCKSYYVKQTVSHVVMNLLPGVSVTNDVSVQ